MRGFRLQLTQGKGRMDGWTNDGHLPERTNQRVSGRTDGQIEGSAENRTDGRTDKRMNGPTNERLILKPRLDSLFFVLSTASFFHFNGTEQ